MKEVRKESEQAARFLNLGNGILRGRRERVDQCEGGGVGLLGSKWWRDRSRTAIEKKKKKE